MAVNRSIHASGSFTRFAELDIRGVELPSDQFGIHVFQHGLPGDDR